jgi:hypothetical protein
VPFEDDISAMNRAYFFRDFTYSSTKFRATGDSSAGEVELADSLLCVGTDLRLARGPCRVKSMPAYQRPSGPRPQNRRHASPD